MKQIITPGRIGGSLTPPASKSHAQRALAAALLAEGCSILSGIGRCADTEAAVRCVEALGGRIERPDATTLAVTGTGVPRGGATLAVGESALALRLFAAVAALGSEPVRIEAAGSLLHRPMETLCDALRQAGARVAVDGKGFPAELCGPLPGGDLRIDGSLSSQVATGLLTALPLAPHDSLLCVDRAVSTPYLELTLDLLGRFGIRIEREGCAEFRIAGRQRYLPARLTVERDWSAAAMLLVAGATAGEVTVDGVSPDSLQADAAVCTALERAGAHVVRSARAVHVAARPLRAFEFDATHSPDLIPALAVLAAAAEGTSLLHGTSRLAHKECDRAAAIREEFGRLGIEVDTSAPDTMRIRGGHIRPASVRSRGDHRMAMSLAVAALRADGPVSIEGAGCVAKSYPEFFDELAKIARNA